GIDVEVLHNPLGGFIKVQKPDQVTPQDLEEIEKIAAEQKALLMIIEPSLAQNLDQLYSAGFVKSNFFLTPVKTLILDLQKTETELWNDLSHSCKYSINRAKREKNTVEFYTNPSEEKLKEFFAVYKETGVAKKYPTKTWEDLKKRVEAFKDKSHLALTYDANHVLDGGKFYVGYLDNVWYIYGGTSAVGRKNKSGYLLLWESMLELKKLGYQKLDLDGVYDPRFPSFFNTWSGFTHFKEKFGGEIVTFPVAHVKYYNKFLKYLFKFGNFNL
ncbi:MAG TPA: hypothetical protein VLI92_03315, partial [Candidatus Saccharimonadales bacterium]|nr:hypothetical protein [Candidatus Saccharimonadales bacterium]